MDQRTDEELIKIIQEGVNEGVPGSQYEIAKRELQLRDRERSQNISWYTSWWMIYIIYPISCGIIGVIVGSIITILYK